MRSLPLLILKLIIGILMCASLYTYFNAPDSQFVRYFALTIPFVSGILVIWVLPMMMLVQQVMKKGDIVALSLICVSAVAFLGIWNLWGLSSYSELILRGELLVYRSQITTTGYRRVLIDVLLTASILTISSVPMLQGRGRPKQNREE